MVVNNLRKKNAAIAGAVSAGVMMSALELQARSQALAPVEFGNLKASAFARMDTQTSAYVGYTALYALFVHEQVGMVMQGLARQPSPPRQGRHWDPQGQAQAKFLEAPARQFQPTFASIVANQVKGVLT